MKYQCFHCLTNNVVWDSDFSFEDFGYEGEGIVHICHCTNCGAEIEYRVRTKPSDTEEDPEDNVSPKVLPVGKIKEYDNGMVTMRKETYDEYQNIAILDAIRRGDFKDSNLK